MKKVFLFVLCFCCGDLFAQHTPVISFINKDSNYDFGAIAAGSDATYEFEIRNTGEADLIIANVKCKNSAFVFKWSDRPIKRGRKTQILVSLNPKDSINTGSFNDDVLITSNATAAPYPFIHLKGAVIPSKGILASPIPKHDFPIEPGYERFNGDTPEK